MILMSQSHHNSIELLVISVIVAYGIINLLTGIGDGPLGLD